MHKSKDGWRRIGAVVLAGAMGVGVVLAGGGCVVVTKRSVKRVSDDAPEGRYTGAIRAARTISFSSDRSEALARIAAKPDLEESDQLRIVDELRSQPGYSGDAKLVLTTLLENPVTTARTRTAVGTHLEEMLSFSADRASVVGLLTDKPAGK